ncbi:non-ribosomal peptide synthetase [Dactylosporangium sp. NPDC000555]|uniref:non-ribosomal peptide synthetase n=1 Tax=Dactylosporangium sp. NPDC000555 TaxID=3154260 RepID=UPI00332FA053
MEHFSPIHDTIAQRAAEAPDAVAVEDDITSLTYRQLVDRTDDLAAELIRRGVRRNDVVAVHMQRSCALVVALLAVSRAGAGSLMLDVDGPRRWLSRFIEVAGPVALITHEDKPALSTEVAVIAVRPDARSAGPAQCAPGCPSQPPVDDAGPVRFPRIGQEDLACLVQTSGSTGEPKLVLVPHRTWSYAAQTQQRLHGITAQDHGAWLFPAHTNVSVSVVIWPFLAAGARLSIPAPKIVAAPEELAVWIRERGVTQFFAVAPLAEAMARLEWPRSALRLMLTGSDRVREWGRYDLPFEVGNWYGANEVNIVTSSVIPWDKRVTSATATEADRSGPPPIGRIWPGVTWRVVDPATDEPVSPGAIGELLVGGEQIAIGYVSARRTAEKFLPDPQASTPGARLYRTGDLVRVRPDGLLEHRGRIDEQVKINGVRVEMADVERALLACPGVREAAAAAVDTASGRQQLVGYVVTDRAVTDGVLRAALVELLPAAMVPAAFIRLLRLPRNRGDKLDRLALPHPDTVVPSPATGATAVVEAVFAELLKVESVAPGDNFLLLGGDSMLAARAARELSRRLGQSVSAKEVLLHPTPVELAGRLNGG